MQLWLNGDVLVNARVSLDNNTHSGSTGSVESTGKRRNWMPSQPQTASWLVENGPKELELLFRAIVFHPSAPLLLTDNDRHYRDASVGASKLLGLPREEIIGRSLDEFAEPGSKPVISERWRAFLEDGEQAGTLQLVGPDGD